MGVCTILRVVPGIVDGGAVGHSVHETNDGDVGVLRLELKNRLENWAQIAAVVEILSVPSAIRSVINSWQSTLRNPQDKKNRIVVIRLLQHPYQTHVGMLFVTTEISVEMVMGLQTKVLLSPIKEIKTELQLMSCLLINEKRVRE
jgi:hypothetical protein